MAAKLNLRASIVALPLNRKHFAFAEFIVKHLHASRDG
jgi:hypothetical protein